MKYFEKMYFLMIGFNRPIFSMFLIYITYLIFGSLCFVSLETQHEERSRNESVETVQRAKDMINTLRSANFSDEAIYFTFLEQHENRLRSENPDSGWSVQFINKVFFAFILITTIGYGNVAPKTSFGQIVCVIYTMFGLPLHVIMMRLLSVKFRGCLRKLFKVGQECLPTSKLLLFVIGTLFFLFWTTLFIFIPAYVFIVMDEWDYSRAVYFSFVTLTTIGLGDYIVASTRALGDTYVIEIIGLLIWMFIGLGFVTMAINMLSYVMGIFTLDKLDCKCKARAAARNRMKPLLDLINEINWQLVKSKPENFDSWDEIENFKNILIENPQDVTVDMLLNMFNIATELKETAYDNVSILKTDQIPLTAVIQQARDNLPEIISQEFIDVSYEEEPRVRKETSDWLNPSSENADESSSNVPGKRLKRRDTRKTRSVIYKGKLMPEKSLELLRRVQSASEVAKRTPRNEEMVQIEEIINEEDSTNSASDEDDETTNSKAEDHSKDKDKRE